MTIRSRNKSIERVVPPAEQLDAALERGHSSSSSLLKKPLHRSLQQQQDNDSNNHQGVEEDRNDTPMHRRQSQALPQLQQLYRRGYRTQVSTLSNERIPSQPDSMQKQSRSKNSRWLRRRRSLSALYLSRTQWAAFLVLASSVRMIWKVTITTTVPNGERNVLSYWSLPEHQILTGEIGRRQRTRPHPPQHSWLSTDTHTRNDGGRQQKSVYPSFPTTNHTSATVLCGKDGADMSTERILISGILSHPAASELALSLAHHCGVHHIAGLAEHLLTVDQSQRMEFLMQQIPKSKLHISEYPVSDFQMQQILNTFAPTIIYHFEPLSFLPGFETPGVFAMRSSLEQLTRICMAMVWTSMSRNGTVATHNDARLVYIQPLRLSRAIHVEDEIMRLHSVQLQAYRFGFGIDAVRLNLPTIYGPFREGASLLGLNENADKFLMARRTASHPVVHITDAVNAIIAANEAMHFETVNGSLEVLSIPDHKKTTLGQLHHTFDAIHSHGTNAIKNAGKLYTMLSWYYRQTTPHTTNFGMLPNKQATIKALVLTSKILNSDSINPNAVSQLERRVHNLLPCNSECSRKALSCRPSAWDTIMPLSKQVTSRCKYLLYAADFSESLTELPEIKESVNDSPWPRAVFCQVAFVSEKSPLVQNALSGDARSTTENGYITSNGWQLIWISETDASLSEADIMMPKIAPSTLFSSQVSTAAYLEPQHMTSIPPLQVLYFLMAKRLHAKAIPEKEVYKKGRKVMKPYVPKKQIIFMGHKFDFYDDELPEERDSGYMTQLAKLVMSQKGKVFGDDHIWPTRQLQAYQKSIQWQQNEDFAFEPVDTYLMIHNLRYAQSRRLRCHWYEEHLFWSSGRKNRDLEDLSLSYVMHRWRQQNWLDTTPAPKSEERWGERLLVQEKKLLDVEVDGSADNRLEIEVFAKLHQQMQARRTY